MLATPERYDFSESILFIEDLAEHLYHIDRMLHALRKTGALEKIQGLIVGGMTELEDTDVPFGMGIEALILEHFQYRKIPICFDFPVSHELNNMPVQLGATYQLSVTDKAALLTKI